MLSEQSDRENEHSAHALPWLPLPASCACSWLSCAPCLSASFRAAFSWDRRPISFFWCPVSSS